MQNALPRSGFTIGAVLAGVVAGLIVWGIQSATESDDAATGAVSPTATEETSAGDFQDASDGEIDGTVDSRSGEFIPAGCPSPDGTPEKQQSFSGQPPTCIDPSLDYSASITTNKGTLTIDLDQINAPVAVNNFVFLARSHYFDDTLCHRIIPEFVVQCGDPTATGTGGPGYTFADELPQTGDYQDGSVAMANSGPDTNGSQFFVVVGDLGASLPPAYSLFGHVTTGFDETVGQMAAVGTQTGSPSEPVEIWSVVIVVS